MKLPRIDPGVVKFFEYGDKAFLLDVPQSLLVRLDPHVHRVVETLLTERMATLEALEDRLAGQLSREQIQQAVEEIGAAVRQGWFVYGGRATPGIGLCIALAGRCDRQCGACLSTDRQPLEGTPLEENEGLLQSTVDLFVYDLSRAARGGRVSFALADQPGAAEVLRRWQRRFQEAAWAAGKACRFHVAMNGLPLPERTVVPLLQAGMSLSVRLEGTEEVQEALRSEGSGKGTDDRIRCAAEALLQLAPQTLVEATLTSETPDLVRLWTHLWDWGFRHVALHPARLPPTHPGTITGQNVGALCEAYAEWVEFLLAQPPYQLACYLSALEPGLDLFARFFHALLRGASYRYRCAAGRSEFAVDGEGFVYPCDRFAAEGIGQMGHVETGLTAEIEETWHRDLALEARREPCRSCWARYLCGGGCYLEAALVHGSLFQPNPVDCTLTRHLIQLGAYLLAQINEHCPQVLDALTPDSPRRQKALNHLSGAKHFSLLGLGKQTS